MPQRLTPLEVSLLALDTAHTPGHVGTVDIFDPGPDGFDYERLIALIRERIAFVPRYRQRVRGIPARLAGPVWVDDEKLRPHLPRATLRAAAARHAGPAPRVRRSGARPTTRPVAATVGDLSGRGSGRRPIRTAGQVTSVPCRWNRQRRDRSGAARLDRSLARNPRRWSR